MKKYYSWACIRHEFTDIIKHNSLKHRLTFVDFKKDNYRITTNYARHVKRLQSTPLKQESTLTNLSNINKSDKFAINL